MGPEGSPELLGLAAQLQLPPADFTMAYGSGAFQQPGAEALRGGAAPMLDFVFSVRRRRLAALPPSDSPPQVADPHAWHAANLERNGGHYSAHARALGPRFVCAVASAGAGLHFNPYVPLPGGRLAKYGVLSTAALAADLATWGSLYVAGRLQKPCAVLASTAPLRAGAQRNLGAALGAAGLLLPPAFSEAQLHTALCGLSYTGDVRGGVGEDAQKVARIAAGSAPGLRQLYSGPVARAARWLTPGADAGLWHQDMAPDMRRALVAALPAALLTRLAAAAGLAADALPAAVAARVCAAPQPEALLRQALAATVRASSRRQAVAGLLACGVATAARYAAAKVSKAWRSRTGLRLG